MATEAQLKQALMKADAAGDTAGAELFAKKIKEMRGPALSSKNQLGLNKVLARSNDNTNINMGVPSTNGMVDGQVSQGTNQVDEKGFLSSVGEFFTGSDRQTQNTKNLPEIGQGGLLFGEDKTKAAAITPALLSATDPEEMAQILQSNFENIGIVRDQQGNVFAANNNTGARVVLNKPGVSQIDILQGLGIASLFTPAGTAQGALRVAGAAGATSAGIEAVQAVSGGDFSFQQIAIDTVAAGLLDKAFTVAKATGRKIRDVLKTDAGVDPDIALQGVDPDILKATDDLIDSAFGVADDAAPPNVGETLREASQPNLTPKALATIKQAEGQGVQLTKAQATGDFASSEAEQTLLKSVSEEGSTARTFADQQQEQLKVAAEKFTEKFGGSSRLTEATGGIADLTARDKGAQIQAALEDVQALTRQEVSSLYKLASEKAGKEIPLNNTSIVGIADDIIVNRPITPEVEKSINTTLAKFGLIGDSVEQSSRNKFKVMDGDQAITITGEVTPLTLKNSEEFRKALNKAVGADQTGSAKLVVSELDKQVNEIIERGAESISFPTTVDEFRGGDGFLIKSENGKIGGRIEGESFALGMSIIKDTTKRGTGEGKALYLSAINEAKKRNLKEIVSDESVTPEAARVWESLKNDGFPVVRNKDARFINDKEGGFWAVDKFSKDSKGNSIEVESDIPVYSMSLTKNQPKIEERTEAFKAARDAFSDQRLKFSAKDVIQDLVSFKKGTSTPVVDPETVIAKIVKGDKAVTNIRKIKQILLETPTEQTKKAWRSIQAETVGDILSQAVNKDTLQISGARLNSAVKKYQPEALRELLGKKQYSELKRLQETIGTATIPPPGTTNPSGTFTKILAMTERLGNFAGAGQFNFGSLIAEGVSKGKQIAARKATLDGIINTKMQALKKANPSMSAKSLEQASKALAFLEIRELDKEEK
jgi:hypothetical protein